MLLEFKLFKMDEKSEAYIKLKAIYDRFPNPRHEFINEFIVVGEVTEDDCYKVLQLHEEGLSLFYKIKEIAYILPKKDFIWDEITYTEIDIPKEYLDMDTIEEIQKLNS